MASTIPGPHKVCLAGLSGVGKTSIFNHIRGKEFSELPKAETYPCFVSCDVEVDGGPPVKVTLQLWDSADQELWKTVYRSYLTAAKAVIIVFSVDCFESVREADREVNRIINTNFCPDALYFLVGNKSDLKREDESQQLIDYCLERNRDVFCGYTMTSAKEGTNVRQLFDDIAQTLVSRCARPVEKSASLLSLHQPPKIKNCCLV